MKRRGRDKEVNDDGRCKKNEGVKGIMKAIRRMGMMRVVNIMENFTY